MGSLCLVFNNSFQWERKKKRKYFKANLEVWKFDIYLLIISFYAYFTRSIFIMIMKKGRSKYLKGLFHSCLIKFKIPKKQLRLATAAICTTKVIMAAQSLKHSESIFLKCLLIFYCFILYWIIRKIHGWS